MRPAAAPLTAKISRARWDSPLGAMLLEANETRLCGVWFEGQKHGPEARHWPARSNSPVIRQAIRELTEYFDGRRRHFDTPIDSSLGTDFQRAVWTALRRIPAGRTSTYAELACRIGRPTAVRAVASAVGRNPVSLLVPCHRVIGSDGSLTGYAGGLRRKAFLLALEKSIRD